MSVECTFCGRPADASKGAAVPCMFAWWTGDEPGSPVRSVGVYCCGAKEGCSRSADRRGHLLDVPLEQWSWTHADRVLRTYLWSPAMRAELVDLSRDVLGTSPPSSMASCKPSFATHECGVTDWTTAFDKRVDHVARQRVALAAGEADAAVLVYERLLTARVMASELFGSEGTDAHLVMRIADAIAAAKKDAP